MEVTLLPDLRPPAAGACSCCCRCRCCYCHPPAAGHDSCRLTLWACWSRCACLSLLAGRSGGAHLAVLAVVSILTCSSECAVGCGRISVSRGAVC